jgi:3-deoxy-D-arabino-heptulosonate 7-phosphate (DAHP) synthase class II
MTQKEEFKKALELLEQIEENVSVCCAVTMEPDEVLELIDKLKIILKKYKNE